MVPRIDTAADAFRHGFQNESPFRAMTHTILVVDDDPVQRRLLEEAARRFGHAVRVTDGGESALALLSGRTERRSTS